MVFSKYFTKLDVVRELIGGLATLAAIWFGWVISDESSILWGFWGVRSTSLPLGLLSLLVPSIWFLLLVTRVRNYCDDESNPSSASGMTDFQRRMASLLLYGMSAFTRTAVCALIWMLGLHIVMRR